MRLVSAGAGLGASGVGLGHRPLEGIRFAFRRAPDGRTRAGRDRGMALRGVDKPEISTERAARMRRRLQLLYGAQADAVWSELARMLEQFADSRPPRATQHWSERDVVLISYPDQVQSDGSTPLAAL